MKFIPTPLAGAYCVELEPLEDERGKFVRTYCEKEFAQIGHTRPFVQMNHSFTNTKGAIRGMHYQLPPAAEDKLIRCVRGTIYDVIVDLRMGSRTFLQHFGAELSASNMLMLYVPKGFAHGFQAQTSDAEMVYHHTQFYTPELEAGFRFDDPRLAINWPLPLTTLSPRDADHPLIVDTFRGIQVDDLS